MSPRKNEPAKTASRADKAAHAKRAEKTSGKTAAKTPPPASAKRRRDRERTITDILDAAEQLLEEKGPDGFGLAELGRQADVSFGLIHHYFGGKEGLLKAVVRRSLREMGREVRRLQADGSFWKPEAPAVLAVFDAFSKRPAFARLTAWGLLTGLLDTEDVEDEFSADREALEAMVSAFRAEAPPHVRDDVTAVTALLLSSVIGFNLLRPLLIRDHNWSTTDDDRVRSLLADAMVSLTRRGPA